MREGEREKREGKRKRGDGDGGTMTTRTPTTTTLEPNFLFLAPILLKIGKLWEKGKNVAAMTILTLTMTTLKPTSTTDDMAKRGASDIVVVKLAHSTEVHDRTRNWREEGKRWGRKEEE